MSEETFRNHSLPPRKTLKGGWDAYCHVCWNCIYGGWVDSAPPDNSKCPFGDHTALTCPEAVGRAQTAAVIAKLIAEGKLTAHGFSLNERKT